MLIGPYTFSQLIRARELLADGAHDALTVRAIAEHIGLSQFHFIRQFAAVYGVTPHRFRTRARLDRAKALLATGAPVTEVCMEIGYSSIGSFSALFTRWVGTSPTGYRRGVQVPSGFAPCAIGGCFGLLAQLSSRNSREATRG